MTIRAVIFDIGGVLVQTVDRSRQQAWEQRLGLPDGSLGMTIWLLPVSERANIGQATVEQVWAEVAQCFALTSAELAQLQIDFWSGGEWNGRLIDYARSLKPRFKTGIISNAWPEAREDIREHVNGDAFDVMLFSAEEGVAKPAQAIYERALTRLNVAPHEAIFVDDVEENVEAARTIGLRAFRFENTDQVIGQINRYLTEVK